MEAGFISCLLNNPELLSKVVSKIKPEYLEDEFLSLIYAKMIELNNFNTPFLAKQMGIDVRSLIDIENLIILPTEQKITQYGYCIFESYKQREVARLINEGNIDNVFEKISEIKKMTFFEEREVDESEVFLKSAEERFRGEEDNRNIQSGYNTIDEKIKGFRKSELIILGGRPASGKTTFGMNIAFNMAKEGKKILFCSLEMSSVELHERIVKSITGVSEFNNIACEVFEKVIKASRYIKNNVSLKIYDKAGMTIEDIICKAKDDNYDAVFIDHLAILKSTRKFKSRYEEVSYLSGRLKVLARELDIPVVCLCQLNRALEGREIKAPTMADLRDSGSIEQDADLVFMVYRPEYHLMNSEPDDSDSKEHIQWEEEMRKHKGKAQIILAKNRRGYSGRFTFGFDGRHYRFYEL